MDSPLSIITELFDLPGASQPKAISPARDKVGRDAADSEQLGKTCMTDGDFEGAIAHFQRAVEQGGTELPEGLLNLGAAYEAADMAPAAFRQYGKALRSQSSGELHVGLGAIYKRYGKVHDAIAEMERAVQMEPGNAFYAFKLAETLRDNGFRTDALAAAHLAVAAKPDDAFYHYWMGDLLLEMHQYAEAAAAFHAALEFQPGDDHVLLLTALALWGQGKRPEAIRAIRLAGDLDSEKPIYAGVLERFLQADGLVEEARLEQKRSAKMDDYDRDLIERLLRKSDIQLPTDTIAGP